MGWQEYALPLGELFNGGDVCYLGPGQPIAIKNRFAALQPKFEEEEPDEMKDDEKRKGGGKEKKEEDGDEIEEALQPKFGEEETDEMNGDEKMKGGGNEKKGEEEDEIEEEKMEEETDEMKEDEKVRGGRREKKREGEDEIEEEEEEEEMKGAGRERKEAEEDEIKEKIGEERKAKEERIMSPKIASGTKSAERRHGKIASGTKSAQRRHGALAARGRCEAQAAEGTKEERRGAHCGTKGCSGEAHKKRRMPNIKRKTQRNTIRLSGSLCPVSYGSIRTGVGHKPESLEQLGAVELDFAERALMLREQCKAERIEAVQKTKGGTPGQFEEQERWQNWYDEEWQPLSIIIDSGAAETVIPHTCVADHPVWETAASKSGVCYSSATNEPIPNLGEQKVPLVTQEGSLRIMTCQVAPVHRPLGSVRRMCQAGHKVIFDEAGSYIENKRTGEINWLREENGNYVLDVSVVPGSVWDSSRTGGFGRQP